MPDTIGQQLRSAREARKLSLQDVEKAIHIRAHYLEALENDDFSRMPSKVQARGFLRLYADFLKIPAGQSGAAIDTPLSEIELPTPSITPPVKPAETENQEVVTPQLEIATSDEEVKWQPPKGQKTSSSAVGEKKPAHEPTRPQEIPNGEAAGLAYFAIYHEIGDQLRNRRQALSLSLDDISLHTRIKREFLEIIEEGRMDDLPSPVQGRGMISNYAEFLNLDSDTLLSRFADALQLKRLELLPPQDKAEKSSEETEDQINLLKKVTRSQPVQTISRFLTPDLLIGGGLALLLVILVVWGAVQVIHPAAPEPEGTAPSISQILLTTPTYDQTLAGTPGNAANTAVPNGTPENNDTAAPSAVATLGGTPSYNLGSQPIQVYVVANQIAFLKVTEDGSIKFNGRVVPGNAYQFSGYNKVELVTGNGAALQVYYNATDLGILGEPGNVVRLVFTRTGYGSPTPAQPAAPTSTRQPTLTLQPTSTATVTPYVP
jgi:cytoskeleton protein RodZ